MHVLIALSRLPNVCGKVSSNAVAVLNVLIESMCFCAKFTIMYVLKFKWAYKMVAYLREAGYKNTQNPFVGNLVQTNTKFRKI